MKTVLNILLFVVCFINLSSQEVYNHVRKGNNDFKNERFVDAEVRYKKALEKDVSNATALYNLGNAVYEQGRFEEAKDIFESSALSFKEREKQAAAYHNMGNSLMAQEKYKESIEAFKKALKLYPQDMETKYNLAYAKKMLEKQQEENEGEGENEQDESEDQENENQENDENEDDGEGDDEQDSNNEEEEEQDGDNEDQEDKNGDEDEQERESQPRPETLTKEEAEQLLKALAEQEAKLQEDLNEEEVEAVKGVIQKEW